MTEELKQLREALRRVKYEAASLADAQVIALEALTAAQPAQTERIAELEAERDTLRAEVERLRVDAERYKWLRDNHESDWAICEWQDDPDGLGYYRDARFPSIVDAAIDTARKATP